MILDSLKNSGDLTKTILTEKLNLSREYRDYVNFEDILNGVSENILHQNISPSESNLLPKRFLKKEEK